jgi:hypothetical protein
MIFDLQMLQIIRKYALSLLFNAFGCGKWESERAADGMCWPTAFLSMKAGTANEDKLSMRKNEKEIAFSDFARYHTNAIIQK